MEKQTIIAHEIAHAYLKHDQDGVDEDMEQEANDLIRSWGFNPNIIDILQQRTESQRRWNRANERKRHDPNDDERRLANKKKTKRQS